MPQKQCPKCGEMVDGAKAFCPECGFALVKEEDREATDFEKMDMTVQFGQTMYNQMLSDMGLSVERESPAKKAAAIETKETPDVAPQPGSSKLKWILLAAIVLLAGLLLIVALAGFLFYFYWPRIT